MYDVMSIIPPQIRSTNMMKNLTNKEITYMFSRGVKTRIKILYMYENNRKSKQLKDLLKLISSDCREYRNELINRQMI